MRIEGRAKLLVHITTVLLIVLSLAVSGCGGRKPQPKPTPRSLEYSILWNL